VNNINNQIQSFLKNEKVVVVEPAISYSYSLVEFLREAGILPENIFLVRRFRDAAELIKNQKPRILLTEYYIGQASGISLIPLMLESMDEATKIAILITHDSASTTIAEAAEEHVDAYILKPFSIGDFTERFNRLIMSKISVSPYQEKIRAGKVFLKSNEFEKAAAEFVAAVGFHEKPTLAYFYAGQALHMQNSVVAASSQYRRGLDINPLHYKCLLGEFDSYFDQKKYSEAYVVAKKIMENFPVTTKRLGNIFISLVFSQHLEDITTYYELYRGLDRKPPELAKIYSAALMVAGKSYLKKNAISKALECFRMGINVIGPDVPYIEAIIRELIKVRSPELAAEYLSLYPVLEIGKSSYSQMAFLIDMQSILDRDELIERGKKLVAHGYADQICYLQFVKFLVDVDKKILAEDMATRAITEFPDLRKELYGIIEGLQG